MCEGQVSHQGVTQSLLGAFDLLKQFEAYILCYQCLKGVHSSRSVAGPLETADLAQRFGTRELRHRLPTLELVEELGRKVGATVYFGTSTEIG